MLQTPLLLVMSLNKTETPILSVIWFCLQNFITFINEYICKGDYFHIKCLGLHLTDNLAYRANFSPTESKIFLLTQVLPEPDMSCLCKEWRSRSVLEAK